MTVEEVNISRSSKVPLGYSKYVMCVCMCVCVCVCVYVCVWACECMCMFSVHGWVQAMLTRSVASHAWLELERMTQWLTLYGIMLHKHSAELIPPSHPTSSLPPPCPCLCSFLLSQLLPCERTKITPTCVILWKVNISLLSLFLPHSRLPMMCTCYYRRVVGLLS